MPMPNEKEKLAHVLMICNWMINACANLEFKIFNFEL